MATATASADAPKPERPGWYQSDVQSIPEEARALLETYSGLKPEEVLPHVLAIRDAGFDLGSYACIGQLRFLTHSFPDFPYYQRVVQRLKTGSTFLDAGCCFGQELRYLINSEGIASERLYGFDLETRFIDLGYDLFRDRDRLRSTLVRGDLSSSLDGGGNNAELAALKGKIDIVYVSSVLHLWNWDDMVAATKRLVELVRKESGAMIVGKQMGSLEAKEAQMPFGMHYRHNVESINKFWAQVARETNTRWTVEAQTETDVVVVRQNKDQWWAKGDPDICMIHFCATRE